MCVCIFFSFIKCKQKHFSPVLLHVCTLFDATVVLLFSLFFFAKSTVIILDNNFYSLLWLLWLASHPVSRFLVNFLAIVCLRNHVENLTRYFIFLFTLLNWIEFVHFVSLRFLEVAVLLIRCAVKKEQKKKFIVQLTWLLLIFDRCTQIYVIQYPVYAGRCSFFLCCCSIASFTISKVIYLLSFPFHFR